MTVYTGNLGIPHLDQNVAQPEIPENTAKEIIDVIIAGKFTTALADADYTFPYVADPTAATDWQNFVHEFTGTMTQTWRVDFPAKSRPYLIINSTNFSMNFALTGQVTPVLLGVGENMYAYSDGTDLVKMEFAPSGVGSTWLSFPDTPNDFTTATGVGWITRINGTSSGLEWYDLASELSTSFATKLNHTSGTITTGTLSGTTTNSGTLSGGTISGATVINYGETSQAVTSTTNAMTIDLANGNVVTYTAIETSTITLSTTHTNTSFTFLVTNFGAFLQTWADTILWEGGTVPTWSVTGTDLITLTKINTTWIGGALIGVA